MPASQWACSEPDARPPTYPHCKLSSESTLAHESALSPETVIEFGSGTGATAAGLVRRPFDVCPMLPV